MEYVAYMYLNGLGTEKNLEKSYNLYLKAFKAGNENVVLNLADCYYYALGVAKNDDKSQTFCLFSTNMSFTLLSTYVT